MLQYKYILLIGAIVVPVCLPLESTVDALKCTEEELMYAPGKSNLFCVFRNVRWRLGTPEPVFEESTAQRVAFVDCNITAVPSSFYARFPRVDFIVLNKVGLEQLEIKNGTKVLYAEENRIRHVQLDGGQFLKELHLKGNPLSSIGDIANSKSLEVLDVSGSKIAEGNSDTVDFIIFAQMRSLKELGLSNVQAYYFENEKNVRLPNLTRLDLSRNPIIPVNFHLSIFSNMPKLEELSLLGTNMGDLNVRSIRDGLPALKRINIAGNNFLCSFMKMFLAHLKEENVEVLGATAVRCDLGYDKMEGFCCKSDGNFFPPPPSITEKPITGSESPSTSTTSYTRETPPINTGTSQELPKTDSGTSEEGSSLPVVIVSVVAVIVVLAVAAFVVIYLKRRTGATHEAVPKNDPNENL